MSFPATVLLMLSGIWAPVSGSETSKTPEAPESEVASSFYIREYRVIGSNVLPRGIVEEAVYGFLGPGRTETDVEGARAALQKAYEDAGYQTVSVNIPPQRTDRGIIVLQVTESKVGRLRVKGSRYFDIEQIKKNAPSLAEGTVPNFSAVQRDMILLNALPDRKITPSVKAGVVPGTVDVELEVKDKLPLHGSLELNNRYSANTTPLRLDLSARYDNLWQLGHTIGFGFQIAPEKPSDALIFSGYYLARFAGVDWFSFMVQGTQQNSDVNTLGGLNSVGNGDIIGGVFIFNLPAKTNFNHSATLSIDYKNMRQITDVSTPVEYILMGADYNAFLTGKDSITSLSAGVSFSLRGLGSTDSDFDNRRFDSSGSFSYFRGSIDHTHELPFGLQFYGEFQGQISGNALVDPEQFSAGGFSTVRGYLESSVLGDNGFAGTLEFRSPDFLKKWGKGSEARLFAFVDGAVTTINSPLPEQQSQFNLWSYGFGATVVIREHWNGSVYVGIPQITQAPSMAFDPRVTFRLWAEL